MSIAVVTGGKGGLGSLIVKELVLRGYVVFIWDLPDLDVTDPASVFKEANALAKSFGEAPARVDVLVNCAGYNKLHRFADLGGIEFDQHMAVNARSILLCARALLPMLAGGTVCNIISNASHMPMRHSLAYNASKAAAEMMTRQMARELGDDGMTIFGVSPNRLKGTPMSESVDQQVAEIRGLTRNEVAAMQALKMPTGEETEPEVVAEFIGFLLSRKTRHKYLHGSVLEYGI